MNFWRISTSRCRGTLATCKGLKKKKKKGIQIFLFKILRTCLCKRRPAAGKQPLVVGLAADQRSLGHLCTNIFIPPPPPPNLLALKILWVWSTLSHWLQHMLALPRLLLETSNIHNFWSVGLKNAFCFFPRSLLRDTCSQKVSKNLKIVCA
jgi:hypothetical protein